MNSEKHIHIMENKFISKRYVGEWCIRSVLNLLLLLIVFMDECFVWRKIPASGKKEFNVTEVNRE